MIYMNLPCLTSNTNVMLEGIVTTAIEGDKFAVQVHLAGDLHMLHHEIIHGHLAAEGADLVEALLHEVTIRDMFRRSFCNGKHVMSEVHISKEFIRDDP
ncbi:hypothetical protein VNO77_00192 [Canavalia gladiata]|uniref:Uncharacterized protein n=1 Tax=Canavalia gladiata TaxID=3824 RepID=A0AAN9R467_CANGL